MIIPILKLRLAYIKRKPISNCFIIFLPVILALLLSILSNQIISSTGGKSKLKPTNFDYNDTDFNLIDLSTNLTNIGKAMAIISDNETISSKIYDIYNKYSKGRSIIEKFSNDSQFYDYINSKDYENTSYIFDSYFEVINNGSERKYKFKNSDFSFDSVLSLENKLTFPEGTISNIFNPHFLLASLLEQSLGNIPSQKLIVSQQFLKRRPQYNIYSGNISMFISLLLTLCYCVFLFSFCDWMLEEKEQKLNYFLYRQGMTKLNYYLSWFIFFLIFSLISSLLTSIIISKMILYNGIYLYTFISNIFFVLNIFAISFFICSFIKKVETGQKLIKFIFIGSSIMGLVLLGTGISKIIRIIFSILPNINYMISLNILLLLDNFNNVDWTLLSTPHNQISLFDSFIISIFSFIFYIIIGILIICYNEGDLKLFNFLKENEEINNDNITIDLEDKSTYFEIHHENLSEKNQKLLSEKNCLSIKNIYKIYGDLKAVNNFNGDIFPDEIFCLLGHNGAGKTTLIKMISGLEEIDNGEIYLDGISLSNNKNYLYENIGLCTQEDLFFGNLTVEEHLEYMSEIKGKKANKEEIYKLIKDIKLEEKKNEFAKNLSGGQKRKLCIALALIGNSKLILLDEPTSGMDVIAKKELWQFLEGYKKDKIIILTTHSLDEAEYLGDRIGIMNEGRFICSGSSSYLKNNYPCGFNINILIDSKISNSNSRKELFNQLKEIDNSAEIKIESKGVFSINFSVFDNKVNELFNLIELNKEKCGIENYTIGTTSLEDVFIKLNNKKDIKDNENQINEEIEVKENIIENKERANFFQQIKTNIIKNLITLSRGKFKLIIEIITSSTLVFLYLTIYQFIQQVDTTKEQNLNSLLIKNTIYYSTINFDFNMINNSYFVKDLMKNKINFEYIEFNKSLSTLSNSEINNLFYDKMKYHYEKLFIIFEKNLTGINVKIFTQAGQNEYYIAATNLILSSFYEKETGIKISAFNEISTLSSGIKQTIEQIALDFTMAIISIIMIWYSFISFINNMLDNPINDKINNIKHLLYLSGENMIAYWIGFIIVDLIKFLIYLIFLLIILIWFDKIYLYSIVFEIPFFIALLLFTYCFSYIFDNQSSAHSFYNLIILFGTFFLIGLSAYIYKGDFLTSLSGNTFSFNFIHDLLPSSTFFIALFNMSFQGFFTQNLKWENYKSILKNNCFVFIIQIIIYSILLFLFEIRIIQKITNIILFHISFKKEDEINLNDSNQEILIDSNSSKKYIEGEKEKVLFEKNLTTKIVNVSKTFFYCCKKNNRVVRNLYLGLESNEKFGLLGFNGSGKSTTFKCITNQIFFDMGTISLFNLDNQKDFEIIRKNIGYCPQENPLFDYLNVYQIINYFRELKGVSESNESIIERFGLKNYKKTLCKNLSGGNKRKLTFAIAIMGKPKIILLDEPSSYVDPESRRGMWKNINKLNQEGNEYNMILTTHSMEEAEVLCDTVSWFKQGNFMCVGNPEKLKIKFSIGYLLHIKFISDNEINDNVDLNVLKEKIIINNSIIEKINSIQNNNSYLGKLNKVIDIIKDNTSNIELKDVGKDFSFQLAINIIEEKKTEIFTQILTMKNNNHDVSEISINTDSLENILTRFN